MSILTKLFESARQARQNSYSPYSDFAVGAAILSTDNKIYTGCNVENISYPCGSCAEQSAISAMINGGSKSIAEILIIADTLQPITPCGACLQRIMEFSTPKTKVHLASLVGIQKSYILADLLPHAFASTEVRNA